ncbi:MAG: hypothetical protein AAFN10_11770 [Bacteroidota bacterium]
MKKVVMFFCGVLFVNLVLAQSDFSNCAAVYLDNDMIITEYSPKGVSKVSLEDKGSLQLRIVNAPDGNWKITGSAQEFRVAIRDQKTGTLVMYGDQAYRRLELSELLAKCQAGDHILILSTNRELGITGAEILID